MQRAGARQVAKAAQQQKRQAAASVAGAGAAKGGSATKRRQKAEVGVAEEDGTKYEADLLDPMLVSCPLLSRHGGQGGSLMRPRTR